MQNLRGGKSVSGSFYRASVEMVLDFRAGLSATAFKCLMCNLPFKSELTFWNSNVHFAPILNVIENNSFASVYISSPVASWWSTTGGRRRFYLVRSSTWSDEFIPKINLEVLTLRLDRSLNSPIGFRFWSILLSRHVCNSEERYCMFLNIPTLMSKLRFQKVTPIW